MTMPRQEPQSYCCESLSFTIHNLWFNHTVCLREWDRDMDEWGCVVLCRTFHIAPEQGQGPTPIVPHCSGPCPGTGHNQCDYTVILMKWAMSLCVNNCRQHRGRIIGVAYSATGDYLYSADSNGSLALYEVGDNRYQVLRVLTNTVARGDHRAPQALTVSPDGQHVAFRGANRIHSDRG